MKKQNQSELLNESIRLLEDDQAAELKLLRQQFHTAYESLKPVNLIKSTWYDITTAPDIKKNILNNLIGVTTGYLSRKVLVGASHNPLKKILGTVLQFVVGNVVARHNGTPSSIEE